MNFNEKLPEWHKEGIEPPESKKTEGWSASDRPPAEWFNWLFHRTYKVFQEIRNVLGGHVDATAPHSGHETPAGAQAKANTAEANAKSYTDTHEQKAAPHSGHETPAGAQEKVTTHENKTSTHGATSAATANRIIIRDASGRAKVAAPSATDDIARKDTVDTVQADLDAHKADDVTQGVHGIKIEEGTWTPTFISSIVAGSHTYSAQYGYYKKIGSLVYIEGYLNMSEKDTSASGALYIYGLPFISSKPSARNGIAVGLNFGFTEPIYLSVFVGRLRVGAVGTDAINIVSMGDAAYVSFQGWYVTD